MFNIVQKAKNRLNDFTNKLNHITDSIIRLDEKVANLKTGLDAQDLKTDGLVNRIEFVREELLFEMRVKNDTFKDKNVRKIETKIISDEKYKEHGLRKINIGCGHIQPEGYINVDARALPGVDVTCEASELPFDDNCLEEIFSSHLVEHFTEFELLRKILPHWKSKLQEGGIIRVVLPDAVSMIKDFNNGEMSFDDLRKVTFGAQDYEGDFHYNMYSFASLTELLIKAGFHDVTLIVDNRKNGLCREMEVTAKK
ncbi:MULTISPECIES: class I SAM-dependent methyltransferase [Enterobacteriaceae]|uniref:class I SAM-dependent methyltransferase n=1 Tax=Enterobacteriaceae TaxID=543 RepID=UPI0015DD06A7|nr:MULTISPECIES: hypothetical protein [unclassified Klebsiella]HAT3952072.1 hypothetical protein [Kluyvera ascorbata]BBR59517.1 hypothetical protein WP4W18E05_28850 [Klebsiella sp. WP4-W18-ESBL-05]BBS91147.1 hypothetical protein WP7S18C02_17620 [Klebsiella sp. WP7-S18-CRE-02]BBS96170.1 hypothetical protein WP7S18C03_17630 [Klebsiella sp. WP7-S18-CRE-03]BBT01200.1 hypothetical protein WP7S18E04_17620 [Klebsiella sp. WP7-S18-ESBL-04]